MPSTLTPWDPFADLLPMRREFERLMAPFTQGPESNLPTRWAPTADMIESADAIVITASGPSAVTRRRMTITSSPSVPWTTSPPVPVAWLNTSPGSWPDPKSVPASPFMMSTTPSVKA